MKRRLGYLDCCQLCIAHFEACGIGMRIEFCLNLQTCCGRGVPNQVHNHFEAAQRPPTPIFCDVAKHPMFNLIPLARAWGKMTDRDRQPNLIGHGLERYLPKATTPAVAAPTIGSDQEHLGLRIHLAPHGLPPPAQGCRGKLGGIVSKPTLTHPWFVVIS